MKNVTQITATYFVLLKNDSGAFSIFIIKSKTILIKYYCFYPCLLQATNFAQIICYNNKVIISLAQKYWKYILIHHEVKTFESPKLQNLCYKFLSWDL